VNIWKKDTTRLDITQEVGKFYYFQENYKKAYVYYSKFIKATQDYNLDIYTQEYLKIGLVYEKMGFINEAESFYKVYDEYVEKDPSIYKSASMAVKYIHENKLDEAIEQYEIFATQENFQYWMVLFMEKDPIMKKLSKHPKYDKTIKKIKDKFWEDHNELKATLKENNLL
jgi:tetratricopeptide (TPR) repeat protein